MKAGYVAVAAAMAVGASASHLHAGHAHGAFHKVARGGYNDTAPPTNASFGCGDCGEYTVWVTTYGEATLYNPPAPPATKSSSTSVHTTPAVMKYTSTSSKSTPTPAPTHAYTAPAPVKPVYSSSSTAPAAAVYSAAAAPKAESYSSSSSGSYSVGGWPKAITYTPYTQSGACKGPSAVAADLAKIKAKGFTVVRTYSTDCSGLSSLSAACDTYGLKLIVGVFISASGCSGAEVQVDAIIAWKRWDLVELIVIGNEAIMSGFTDAGGLAAFISSSKAKFKAAGYTGPCTTSEPMSMMLAHANELCDVIDVAGANIHAFFNPDTPAEMAGSFVAGQIEILDNLCPGKSAVNLECGWPNAGSGCNGQACPGKGDQVKAIASILEVVGHRSVIFSFEDDYWKPAGGAFGVEQHWGAFDTCFGS